MLLAHQLASRANTNGSTCPTIRIQVNRRLIPKFSQIFSQLQRNFTPLPAQFRFG
ncbi:hypothetical protein HMPREF0293_0372 [Corynebacterium glucuronolyticum ATCC 51866]|uniref:Uncharacterized protein n=1 Tax=Corynebacterium glucuronolyticum ATCC 51866 TaxID=548478 RepID=A0ABP2DY81_9CORY|nr:hypothetical protein HMPREF0293_0372 [Corynebacterium glucuronolyticum ATCC 51866]